MYVHGWMVGWMDGQIKIAGLIVKWMNEQID